VVNRLANRLPWAVAVSMLVTLPALALDLQVEVAPRSPITRHVALVVDRSGSMTGDPIRQALLAVNRFLVEPTDELQVALFAFADDTSRWPGIPEPGGPRPVPPGWAALPSETAMQQAEEWLQSFPTRGGTIVIPALRDALKEPRLELSIVLVSDGKFSEDQVAALPGIIAEAQVERAKAGLGEAVVACYGLGDQADSLRAIAQAGGGGYFREAPAPDMEALLDLTPPATIKSVR
jgi:Mg-chelatase subunit ChlD